MENSQQSTSSAVDEGSSATSGQTNSQTNSQEEMVSKADLKRALDDMHKFKSAKVTLESELAELKKQGLKGKEEYKTLYEQEEVARKAYETKYERLKVGFSEHLKLQSVEAEAAKAGLNKDFYDVLQLMPKDGVVVEVDEGEEVPRFKVRGVDSFLESLKRRKPGMFNQSPPRVDSGGGSGKSMTTGEVSIQDIIALEKKDPKKASELWNAYIEQKKQRH